jgi:hypothetical protein
LSTSVGSATEDAALLTNRLVEMSMKSFMPLRRAAGCQITASGAGRSGREVVLCRVAAAGDAGGCGGVGAFGAFSELGGKLGRVFAAHYAEVAVT